MASVPVGPEGPGNFHFGPECAMDEYAARTRQLKMCVGCFNRNRSVEEWEMCGGD
jgi:hypothetical protein